MTDTWAIIKEETIHHEGDERSRTNPGHGYPAYSEKYTTYKEYTDYSKFISDVEWHTKCRHTIKIVQVIPLTIKTELKIEVTKGK